MHEIKLPNSHTNVAYWLWAKMEVAVIDDIKRLISIQAESEAFHLQGILQESDILKKNWIKQFIMVVNP